MDVPLLKPELGIELFKLIILRENYIKKLKNDVLKKNKNYEVDLNFINIIDVLREITIQLLDVHKKWEESQLSYPDIVEKFLWNNENYIEKLKNDLSFLNDYINVILWLGFQINNNPFLIPPELYNPALKLPTNSSIIFGQAPKIKKILKQKSQKVLIKKSPYNTPIINDPEVFTHLSTKNQLNRKNFAHFLPGNENNEEITNNLATLYQCNITSEIIEKIRVHWNKIFEIIIPVHNEDKPLLSLKDKISPTKSKNYIDFSDINDVSNFDSIENNNNINLFDSSKSRILDALSKDEKSDSINLNESLRLTKVDLKKMIENENQFDDSLVSTFEGSTFLQSNYEPSTSTLAAPTSLIWTPHEINLQKNIQRRGGDLFSLTAAGTSTRIHPPRRKPRFVRMNEDLNTLLPLLDQNNMLIEDYKAFLIRYSEKENLKKNVGEEYSEFENNPMQIGFHDSYSEYSIHKSLESIDTNCEKSEIIFKILEIIKDKEDESVELLSRIKFLKEQIHFFSLTSIHTSISDPQRQREIHNLPEGKVHPGDEKKILEVEDLMARRIQKLIRRAYSKSLRRLLNEKYNKAAIRIQSFWRIARVNLTIKVQASKIRLALLLQRKFREKSASMLREALRTEAINRSSALNIQRCYRGYCGRRRLNIKRKFIRSLQIATESVSLTYLQPGDLEDLADRIESYLSDSNVHLPLAVLSVFRGILYILNGDTSEAVVVGLGNEGFTEKKFIYSSNCSWQGMKLILRRKGRLLRRLRAFVKNSCLPNPAKLFISNDCYLHLKSIRDNIKPHVFETIPHNSDKISSFIQSTNSSSLLPNNIRNGAKKAVSQLYKYVMSILQAYELQDNFPEYFTPGLPSWFRDLILLRENMDRCDLTRRIELKAQARINEVKKIQGALGKRFKHISSVVQQIHQEVLDAKQNYSKSKTLYKKRLEELKNDEAQEMDTLKAISRARALAKQIVEADLRDYQKNTLIIDEKEIKKLQYAVDMKSISLIEAQTEEALVLTRQERNNRIRDFDKILKLKTLQELGNELGKTKGELLMTAESWKQLVEEIGGIQYLPDLRGERLKRYNFIQTTSINLIEKRKKLLLDIEREFANQYAKIYENIRLDGIAANNDGIILQVANTPAVAKEDFKPENMIQLRNNLGFSHANIDHLNLYSRSWDNPSLAESEYEDFENHECSKRDSESEFRKKRKMEAISLDSPHPWQPLIVIIDVKLPREFVLSVINGLKPFSFEYVNWNEIVKSSNNIQKLFQSFFDNKKNIVLLANRGYFLKTYLKFDGILGSILDVLLPRPRSLLINAEDCFSTHLWLEQSSLERNCLFEDEEDFQNLGNDFIKNLLGSRIYPLLSNIIESENSINSKGIGTKFDLLLGKIRKIGFDMRTLLKLKYNKFVNLYDNRSDLYPQFKQNFSSDFDSFLSSIKENLVNVFNIIKNKKVQSKGTYSSNYKYDGVFDEKEDSGIEKFDFLNKFHNNYSVINTISDSYSNDDSIFSSLPENVIIDFLIAINLSIIWKMNSISTSYVSELELINCVRLFRTSLSSLSIENICDLFEGKNFNSEYKSSNYISSYYYSNSLEVHQQLAFNEKFSKYWDKMSHIDIYSSPARSLMSSWIISMREYISITLKPIPFVIPYDKILNPSVNELINVSKGGAGQTAFVGEILHPLLLPLMVKVNSLPNWRIFYDRNVLTSKVAQSLGMMSIGWNLTDQSNEEKIDNYGLSPDIAYVRVYHHGDDILVQLEVNQPDEMKEIEQTLINDSNDVFNFIDDSTLPPNPQASDILGRLGLRQNKTTRLFSRMNSEDFVLLVQPNHTEVIEGKAGHALSDCLIALTLKGKVKIEVDPINFNIKSIQDYEEPEKKLENNKLISRTDRIKQLLNNLNNDVEVSNDIHKSKVDLFTKIVGRKEMYFYNLLSNWSCIDSFGGQLNTSIMRARYLVLSSLSKIGGYNVRLEAYEERFGEIRLLVFGLEGESKISNSQNSKQIYEFYVNRQVSFSLLPYSDERLEKPKLEGFDTLGMVYLFADRLTFTPTLHWKNFLSNSTLASNLSSKLDVKLQIRKSGGPGKLVGRKLLNLRSLFLDVPDPSNAYAPDEDADKKYVDSIKKLKTRMVANGFNVEIKFDNLDSSKKKSYKDPPQKLKNEDDFQWNHWRKTGSSIHEDNKFLILVSVYEVNSPNLINDLRLVCYHYYTSQTVEYRISALERALLFKDDENFLTQILNRFRLVFADFKFSNKGYRTLIKIPELGKSKRVPVKVKTYEVEEFKELEINSNGLLDDDAEVEKNSDDSDSDDLSDSDDSENDVDDEFFSKFLSPEEKQFMINKKKSYLDRKKKKQKKSSENFDSNTWGWGFYFNRAPLSETRGNFNLSLVLSTEKKRGFELTVYNPRSLVESYSFIPYNLAIKAVGRNEREVEEELANLDEAVALDLLDSLFPSIHIKEVNLNNEGKIPCLVLSSNSDSKVQIQSPIIATNIKKEEIDADSSSSDDDSEDQFQVILSKLKYVPLKRHELAYLKKIEEDVVINLEIVSASDLAKQGLFGSRNAFCIIRYNMREIGRTSAYPTTLNPNWRQQYIDYVSSLEKQVEVPPREYENVIEESETSAKNEEVAKIPIMINKFSIYLPRKSFLSTCIIEIEVRDTDARGRPTEFLGLVKINGQTLNNLFLEGESLPKKTVTFDLMKSNKLDEEENKNAGGKLTLLGFRSKKNGEEYLNIAKKVEVVEKKSLIDYKLSIFNNSFNLLNNLELNTKPLLKLRQYQQENGTKDEIPQDSSKFFYLNLLTFRIKSTFFLQNELSWSLQDSLKIVTFLNNSEVCNIDIPINKEMVESIKEKEYYDLDLNNLEIKFFIPSFLPLGLSTVSFFLFYENSLQNCSIVLGNITLTGKYIKQLFRKNLKEESLIRLDYFKTKKSTHWLKFDSYWQSTDSSFILNSNEPLKTKNISDSNISSNILNDIALKELLSSPFSMNFITSTGISSIPPPIFRLSLLCGYVISNNNLTLNYNLKAKLYINDKLLGETPAIPTVQGKSLWKNESKDYEFTFSLSDLECLKDLKLEIHVVNVVSQEKEELLGIRLISETELYVLLSNNIESSLPHYKFNLMDYYNLSSLRQYVSSQAELVKFWRKVGDDYATESEAPFIYLRSSNFKFSKIKYKNILSHSNASVEIKGEILDPNKNPDVESKKLFSDENQSIENPFYFSSFVDEKNIIALDQIQSYSLLESELLKYFKGIDKIYSKYKDNSLLLRLYSINGFHQLINFYSGMKKYISFKSPSLFSSLFNRENLKEFSTYYVKILWNGFSVYTSPLKSYIDIPKLNQNIKLIYPFSMTLSQCSLIIQLFGSYNPLNINSPPGSNYSISDELISTISFSGEEILNVYTLTTDILSNKSMKVFQMKFSNEIEHAIQELKIDLENLSSYDFYKEYFNNYQKLLFTKDSNESEEEIDDDDDDASVDEYSKSSKKNNFFKLPKSWLKKKMAKKEKKKAIEDSNNNSFSYHGNILLSLLPFPSKNAFSSINFNEYYENKILKKPSNDKIVRKRRGQVFNIESTNETSVSLSPKFNYEEEDDEESNGNHEIPIENGMTLSVSTKFEIFLSDGLINSFGQEFLQFLLNNQSKEKINRNKKYIYLNFWLNGEMWYEIKAIYEEARGLFFFQSLNQLHNYQSFQNELSTSYDVPFNIDHLVFFLPPGAKVEQSFLIINLSINEKDWFPLDYSNKTTRTTLFSTYLNENNLRHFIDFSQSFNTKKESPIITNSFSFLPIRLNGFSIVPPSNSDNNKLEFLLITLKKSLYFPYYLFTKKSRLEAKSDTNTDDKAESVENDFNSFTKKISIFQNKDLYLQILMLGKIEAYKSNTLTKYYTNGWEFPTRGPNFLTLNQVPKISLIGTSMYSSNLLRANTLMSPKKLNTVTSFEAFSNNNTYSDFSREHSMPLKYTRFIDNKASNTTVYINSDLPEEAEKWTHFFDGNLQTINNNLAAMEEMNSFNSSQKSSLRRTSVMGSSGALTRKMSTASLHSLQKNASLRRMSSSNLRRVNSSESVSLRGSSTNSINTDGLKSGNASIKNPEEDSLSIESQEIKNNIELDENSLVLSIAESTSKDVVKFRIDYPSVVATLTVKVAVGDDNRVYWQDRVTPKALLDIDENTKKMVFASRSSRLVETRGLNEMQVVSRIHYLKEDEGYKKHSKISQQISLQSRNEVNETTDLSNIPTIAQLESSQNDLPIFVKELLSDSPGIVNRKFRLEVFTNNNILLGAITIPMRKLDFCRALGKELLKEINLNFVDTPLMSWPLDRIFKLISLNRLEFHLLGRSSSDIKNKRQKTQQNQKKEKRRDGLMLIRNLIGGGKSKEEEIIEEEEDEDVKEDFFTDIDQGAISLIRDSRKYFKEVADDKEEYDPFSLVQENQLETIEEVSESESDKENIEDVSNEPSLESLEDETPVNPKTQSIDENIIRDRSLSEHSQITRNRTDSEISLLPILDSKKKVFSFLLQKKFNLKNIDKKIVKNPTNFLRILSVSHKLTGRLFRTVVYFYSIDPIFASNPNFFFKINSSLYSNSQLAQDNSLFNSRDKRSRTYSTEEISYMKTSQLPIVHCIFRCTDAISKKVLLASVPPLLILACMNYLVPKDFNLPPKSIQNINNKIHLLRSYINSMGFNYDDLSTKYRREKIAIILLNKLYLKFQLPEIIYKKDFYKLTAKENFILEEKLMKKKGMLKMQTSINEDEEEDVKEFDQFERENFTIHFLFPLSMTIEGEEKEEDQVENKKNKKKNNSKKKKKIDSYDFLESSSNKNLEIGLDVERPRHDSFQY